MIGIKGVAKKPITDATATSGDVIAGKTFYNKYGKQTGTLRVILEAYDYEKSDLIAFDSTIDQDHRTSASNMCVFDNKLYIFSSCDDGNYTQSMLIYDIKTKKWTIKYLGSGSSNQYFYPPCVVGKKIYMKKASASELYTFNVATLESTYLFSTGWIYSYANMFGDFYWSFGTSGSVSSSSTSTLSKINSNGSQTVVQTNLPFGGASMMCEYHGKIHMCYCLDGYTNLKHYALANGKLTQLSSMIQTNYGIKQTDLFVYEDTMFLMGNLRYVYNESEDSWTQIIGTIVESGFYTGEFFQYNEKLYSICRKSGSYSYDDTCDIYEIYKRYNVRK